jgi:tetratricopeptide (TPR) repeat protein
VVRTRLGDIEGAIADFLRALELDPSYTGAIRNIGLAYEAAGDTARARHAYQQYLRAAPNAPDRRDVQAQMRALR